MTTTPLTARANTITRPASRIESLAPTADLAARLTVGCWLVLDVGRGDGCVADWVAGGDAAPPLAGASVNPVSDAGAEPRTGGGVPAAGELGAGTTGAVGVVG
jgi:hypothetical protein